MANLHNGVGMLQLTVATFADLATEPIDVTIGGQLAWVEDENSVYGWDPDGASWVFIAGAPVTKASASYQSLVGVSHISPALGVNASFLPVPVSGLTYECAGFTTANVNSTLTPEVEGQWIYRYQLDIRVSVTEKNVALEAEIDLWSNQNRGAHNVTLYANEGWKVVSGEFMFDVPGDYALSAPFRVGVTHRLSDIALSADTTVFEIRNYNSTLTWVGDC